MTCQTDCTLPEVLVEQITQQGLDVMSNPDLEKRKADLISELHDVSERILALAAALKPDQRDEILLGTWSSREMLAHLAGWLETNVRAANEILAGEVPGFYEYADEEEHYYQLKQFIESGRKS